MDEAFPMNRGAAAASVPVEHVAGVGDATEPVHSPSTGCGA